MYIYTVLQAFINYMRIEVGASDNTLSAYTSDLRSFEAFLTIHGITLALSDHNNVSAYIQQQSSLGRSSSTLRRRVASCRAYYQFQSRVHGRDVVRLMACLDQPKLDRSIPDVLGHQQVVTFISAGRTNRDRAIAELLYSSGLRASELVNLTRDQINYDDRTVTVIGKGNKERQVPMTKAAAEAIYKYRAGVLNKTEPHVFLTDEEKPLTRNCLGQIIKALRTRSGLAINVHPHTLRHTFASHLLQGGANLRVIQELMGHDNVETTAVYLHTDVASLKRTHALLGH